MSGDIVTDLTRSPDDPIAEASARVAARKAAHQAQLAAEKTEEVS